MSFLALLPAILSFLLLGAHFLRAGNLLLVGVSLAMIPLLLVPRRWAAITAQTVLVLGCIEWLLTMNAVVSIRVETGQPWQRPMAILLAVAVVTMLSAILFRSTPLRRRYQRA
jgi:hypothetical protein